MAKRKIKLPRPKSQLEEKANLILLAENLASGLEREHRFHPTRKWRFDFAWPEFLVALEIEGGLWSKGRHVNPQGFISDCEKYNEASSLGWAVIRCPPTFISSKMVTWVKDVIQRRSSIRDSDERTL